MSMPSPTPASLSLSLRSVFFFFFISRRSASEVRRRRCARSTPRISPTGMHFFFDTTVPRLCTRVHAAHTNTRRPTGVSSEPQRRGRDATKVPLPNRPNASARSTRPVWPKARALRRDRQCTRPCARSKTNSLHCRRVFRCACRKIPKLSVCTHARAAAEERCVRERRVRARGVHDVPDRRCLSRSA